MSIWANAPRRIDRYPIAACRRLVQVSLVAALGLLLCSGQAAAQQRGGPPITISAKLDVIVIDDFEHGRSALTYFIRDLITGQITELRFERAPTAALMTGDKVLIRGREEAGRIWVSEVAALEEEPNPDPGTSADGLVAPLDIRDTVVLLVDFDTNGDGIVMCEINIDVSIIRHMRGGVKKPEISVSLKKAIKIAVNFFHHVHESESKTE